MASFVVLTPVTGPGRDHEKTRFVREGFSLAAFLFPGIWLLCHRFWLLGIGALLLQGIGMAFMGNAHLWAAGLSLVLAVSVLTAVEGRMLVVTRLAANGFDAVELVSARNLAEAEEIYFSGIPLEEAEDIRPVDWDIRNAAASTHRGAALGLIGYDGGR